MDSPSNRHGDGGYTDVDCPVKECGLKVDIHIVSGDSVTLGAHTKILTFFENFPSPPKSDKVIRMEEEADVLQVLLRFMHNARQPDLSIIPFTRLFSVAEAAEKYLIHSAMERCKIQMGIQTFQEPIGVWIYAVKYNYPPLANEAAPLTLQFSPSDVLIRAKENMLDETSVMQWLRYREQWSYLFMSLLEKPKFRACEHWERFHYHVILGIGYHDQVTGLMHFHNIVANHKHDLKMLCCSDTGEDWSAGILKKIQGLELYSDCL